MPERLFFELPEEKRKKIVEAAINEFADYGYENGSTNRIVRECGISKGSLFGYFAGKEELYLYILDTVTAELAAHMEEGAASLPTGLFERITEYAALEIAWYMRNPSKGRLIVKAFTKSDTDIYRRVAERYGAAGEDVFSRFIEQAECAGMKHDKALTTDIIRWTLTGYNERFRANIGGDISFERLREEYIAGLSAYMDILKDCV